ncbi:ubiquinol-cytochrome c reductase iron-sulfur subunit [Paenibacillus sp. JSM ZJ436]|uniref:Menaquinol:cytochrome c reductase iron-sulfur subunit n=1 Tax=Paenibacillus algicola TaxID=2565926 RepID=A0A4P8XJN3_9BACL|nr:ubiquinol-cytochrome c reductase iron-sulfur subunit [Paenibacillus algicola]QCT02585.1 Tat pathway signal sequence domain protein [Paenibacillus algicola]
MNNNHNDEHEESHKPPRRKEMSRRQFLTYTLGGATAYMAAGVVIPMVRFAVDPILQKGEDGSFVKVVEGSKITAEPQEFDFELKQQDGWYNSTAQLTAWISKTEDGQIVALSPVCKHLGCMVGWNNNDSHPNEFYCPCHGARYTANGKNLAVAPQPLDMYDVKEEGGWIYLGAIIPNTVAK